MAEQVIDPAIQKPESNVTSAPSLLEGGEKPAGGKPEGSILDQAAQDAKAAQEAEEKRLLEADVNTLSKEDQDKRVGIEKTREEKRLLDADPKTLSAEDQAKREVLVKAKEAADAKAKGIPEKYEFKMPEGVTLDQALVDKATPVFKAKGINQEQAQAVVDLYIEIQNAATKAQEDNYNKFLEDSKKETLDTLGAKYKEEMAYAVKIRALFSDETRELFTAAGLGDNKYFLLDLIKIGKMFSEAKLIDGPAAAGAGEKTPGQVLYG